MRPDPARRATPPHLAELLLKLALPPGVAGESIKGDLDQEFQESLSERSLARARAWYYLESMRFGARYVGLRLCQLFSSRRRVRGPSGDNIMIVMWQDTRHAMRRLLRSPLFSLVAVLTLAIGIGANTAIFSLVNGILLKPLPFDEPERLVGVWHTAPGIGVEELNQSPGLHYTYIDEGRSFSELGMWRDESASVTGLDEPEEVRIMRVTDGTFRALRLRPALGRSFLAEDGSPGTPSTVILSYDYWQTRFGGDPAVLGRALTVDGSPREIIGVMGADTRFLQFDPAFYLPFRFNQAEIRVGNFSYQALARLAPGVTLDQANADVARMLPMAVDRFPGGVTRDVLEQGQFGPNIRPLKADVVGDVGDVLWVLLGTVGMILLIACANVSNLFLVRAESREKEMAVRTALGAARSRIARDFLSESLLLGVLGGLGGIALAYGGLALLRSLGPAELPRLADVTIDWQVLLFTLVLSAFSGAFFGMFPVLRYQRPGLTNALKEGGRGASTGKEKHRARNTLVVVQIALALLLLVGSGLMIRSFRALRNVDPGFRDAEEVLLVRLSIPSAQVEDAAEVAQTHRLISERIGRIPGVNCVGSASSVTMDGWESNNPVFVEEFPVPEGQLPELRRFKWLAEGYFETMRIPVIAGRALDWRDGFEFNKVVMVTENFAREYWGTPADALGKRISTGRKAGNWYEIVGVSGNVRDQGLDREPSAVVYWPAMLRSLWPDTPGDTAEVSAQHSMNYAIRSARVGTPGLLADVRDAIWSVNPNLSLARVMGLDELLDRSMARTSFSLIMLGIAAAVALILGTIGIYGVISYVVSQRTRELGVRLALGANAGDVKKMVLKQGMILCAFGVLFGLGAAIGLTHLMEALLFGVDPLDPVTFVAVSVSLTVVALMASYVPAARAAAIDPVEAIRYEA